MKACFVFCIFVGIYSMSGFKENMRFYPKLISVLLSSLIAVMPLLSGYCECAVEGAVCGDPPTWNTCCEPDKYECVKDKGDDYGTCEEKNGDTAEAAKEEAVE